MEDKLEIVDFEHASESDLLSFHGEDYINALSECEEWPDYNEASEEEKEDMRSYGLLDDNPPFSGVFEYTTAVAGASLKASEHLKKGARIVMNFGGGRHHAHAQCAAGFCYVNDIVLLIDSLRYSCAFCLAFLQMTFKKQRRPEVSENIIHRLGYSPRRWGLRSVLFVK